MVKSISCQRCGKCCDWNNVLLWIFPRDVRRWIDEKRFDIIKQTCFAVSKGNEQQWTFRKQDDGHCVWYSPEGCRIYATRPVVCRVYPAINGHPCLNGTVGTLNKAEHKHFIKASREWKRATVQWRQDKLKELLAYVHVLDNYKVVKQGDATEVVHA